MSAFLHKIWEHLSLSFVGGLNVVLGTVTWVEGNVIPHVMIWGGLGALVINYVMILRRKAP